MIARRLRNDDRGYTLVEMLVVFVLIAGFAALVVGLMITANRTTTRQTFDAQAWASMEDASGQLARDINDARAIILAEPNALTVQDIRDDKCQARSWVADAVTGTLTVTTTYFEQLLCSGPSSSATKQFIGNDTVATDADGNYRTTYTSDSTFAYYAGAGDTPLAVPIPTDQVTRVEWTLAVKASAGAEIQTLPGAASYTGTGDTTAGSGQDGDPLAPLLCASLHAPLPASCGAPPAAASGGLEGVSAPVLQWVDPTPSLTTSWTVMRRASAPGGTLSDQWQILNYQDASQTWYIDTTLPAGYTAQYVVRATVPTAASGVGPASNQVVTGLRPAAPTITATGAATSIALAWTHPIGATSFDVYRDGTLVASLGDVTTWTDRAGTSTSTQALWATGTDAGYGHSHYYRVVATNRWESALVTGTESGRAPLGADLSATYSGRTRAASAQAGAYTAPPRATLTVTAQANRTSALTWTAGTWTGNGPTAGRITGWQVHYRSSNEADQVLTTTGATTLTYTHGSRPAGRYSEYRINPTNAQGPGPVDGFTRAWQRPATPGCATTGRSTRSLTIGATPISATSDESYSTYQLRMDIDGSWKGSSATWDPLTDASTYGFRVRVQGAGSGLWSDEGSCSGTTATLTASVPTCVASVTDSVELGAITVSGGDQVKLGSSGTVYSSPRSFSGLPAGTFKGYARGVATDGYNTSYSAWDDCPARTINPWVHLGSSGGSASASCALYVAYGTVINSLDASWYGATPPAGLTIGPSISGSASADYGTYQSGSAAGGDLVCIFYRKHSVYLTLTGDLTGDYIANVRWSMGGPNAV